MSRAATSGFESGGDVSEHLRQEYSDSPREPAERPISPKVRELLEHHIQGRQDAEIAYARADERNRMLVEALSPQQPAPAQEERPRYREFNVDPLGYLHDVAQKVEQFEQQLNAGQQEQAERSAYFASMDAANQADPNFLAGYRHLMASRTLEKMSSRFPQATNDQLMAAVRQGQIPPDSSVGLGSETNKRPRMRDGKS
jgi:hypothetical protein